MASWWLTLSINLMVCNYGKNFWVRLWGSFLTDLGEAGRLTLKVVSIRPRLAVLYGIIWIKQIKYQHVYFKHLDSEYRCLLIMLQCFIYCDKLETSNCANIPSLTCFCQVTREQMKVSSLLLWQKNPGEQIYGGKIDFLGFRVSDNIWLDALFLDFEKLDQRSRGV